MRSNFQIKTPEYPDGRIFMDVSISLYDGVLVLRNADDESEIFDETVAAFAPGTWTTAIRRYEEL